MRTVIAHDVDEHAHNLTNWEQSYDQVAAGSFDGMLEEWHAHGVQIFRERSSRAVRQSCCVWPDAYWFGMEPQTQAGGMRINGRLVNAGMVMTRPGSREFELMTPEQHSILGIVIQRNTLLEAADQHASTIAWEQLAQAELLQVDHDMLAVCRQKIATLLDGTSTHEQQIQQQQQIVAALVGMLDSSAIETEACSSLQRRRRIVSDACAYAMQHQTLPVNVPMLCAHVHVSRRTLQYCFEEVMGLSPMTYLRSLRLNGVRRQLRDGADGTQRIGDVAASWGFTNFSQFSCDYKKLFGTSPSAALRNVT